MLASAATQTTAHGRVLNALAEIGGRAYAGYGDYSANTGPIHVCSVDVADVLGEWTDHLTVDSEQLGAPVLLTDGRLVVPHIDPRIGLHGGFGGGYAQRAVDGTWADLLDRVSADEAWHIFDMADHDGSLWAAGARRTGTTPDDAPTVWRSTDGGDTWAVSLAAPSTDSGRFYCLAVTSAGLHVKSSSAAYRWDGSAWVDDGAVMLPDGVDGGPGVAWRDGGFVVPSELAYGAQRRDLYYFDGTTHTLIAAATGGFSVGDDGALYFVAGALGAQASALRVAPDGPLTTTTVAAASFAPADLVGSLCVLPGCTRAVVGRTDSRLQLVDLT